jgi:transcriptional regulator with XRE-family HTH domain
MRGNKAIAKSEREFCIAVGRRIAKLREQRGVKAIDLARSLGLSRNQMYLYETGVNRCSIFVLTRIATRLSVSVENLLH